MTRRRTRSPHRNRVPSGFTPIEGCRNDQIVQLLDRVEPRRLKDIARAIGHEVCLMSGHMKSLIAQGRIKRVRHGYYVRLEDPPMAAPAVAA